MSDLTNDASWLGIIEKTGDSDKQALVAALRRAREEVDRLNGLISAIKLPAKTCRHGRAGKHMYGDGDEPSYNGGPVSDVAWFCDGPEEDW